MAKSDGTICRYANLLTPPEALSDACPRHKFSRIQRRLFLLGSIWFWRIAYCFDNAAADTSIKIAHIRLIIMNLFLLSNDYAPPLLSLRAYNSTFSALRRAL